MSITTDKHTALATLLGHGGHVDDLEYEWLLSEGVPEGHINDMWLAFFHANGATSDNWNDAASEFLAGAGFTGNLSSAWAEYWAAGGGGGAPPLVGFVSVWRTTAANETVTIPLTTGTFNATVNWGDGSADSIITSSTDADRIHTYATAGDHTVTITGTFPNIFFNNGGDRLKLIKILNWGAVGWMGMNSAFYGCANLNEISATDAVNLPSGAWAGAFRSCTSLPSINLTGYTGTPITGANVCTGNAAMHTAILPGFIKAGASFALTAFFDACSALINLDISGWNTATINSMATMLRNCSSLANLVFPVGWNTSQVISMANMFQGTALLNPNVSGFNMGLVTGATAMFTEPSGLSDANYDALLIAWAAQSPALQNAVVFGAGGAKYSAGAATSARAVLTGTHTWAITDGGPAALLVNDEMQGPVEDVSTRTLNVDVSGAGWNVLTGGADVGEGQTVVGPGGVRAVINSGSPNVVITCIVQAFAPVGLLLRSRVGGIRALRVMLNMDGTLNLERVDAGAVVTTLASIAAMPAADTAEHHLQVWVDAASRFLVYFDGVLLIDHVEAYQMGRPRHGILAGPGAVYLREFSIAEYPV